MREPPLSPHLSVYRFMYTMALSIMHRIAGVWLTLGLCALVYWLASAAAGESAYEQAVALSRGWFAKLLLLSWLAAFCYHFANGLRHLSWDAGWGLEKRVTRRTGWAALAVAIAGFLVAAYLLFCPRAGAL